MDLKKIIAKKTLRIRYKIVKVIAPRTCENDSTLANLVTGTPRPMIAIVKARFNHPLVGAEIGVLTGDNTLSILEMLPIKTLYLIDPYFTSYVQNGLTQRIPSEDYDLAKQKLAGFSQKTKWIIKTSDEAHKHIPEPLDFLYIDGNHTYEYVKRDITNYYPLIKPGGIIGGHDYTRDFKGVAKASNEFAKKNGVELNVIFPDWWIFKPREDD